MQIYGFCPPAGTQNLLDRVAEINDVSLWKRLNHLQLNTAKTKTLWCTSAHQQHLISSDLVSVCCDLAKPTKYVRDLSIYIDFDTSMKTHICVQLLCIWCSICQLALLSLITSLLLLWLHYRSLFWYGITDTGISRRVMDRLQSVLNAAARLVYNLWPHFTIAVCK